MTCEEVAKLIHEYLDCEMCEDARFKIQAHLSTCHKRFGKFQFEEGLRDLVRNCAKCELPQDLCDRISVVLEKETNH